MSNLSPTYQISRKKMLLLISFTLLLLVLDAALLLQNRALKAASTGGARAIVLQPGKVLPPLEGLDMQGNKLTFDYGRDPRKTVLLVFSPRCHFCTKNMPNWRELTRRLDSNSYRVVAVASVSEGVNEYVARHELQSIPVVAEPDPRNRVAYEMNITPQTLLIDSNGKVEKVWTGLLRDGDRLEIENTLGVQLPALSLN